MALTCNELFDNIKHVKGLSRRSIALTMGQSNQQFAQKLKRCTMRADELFEVCETIGIDVRFYDKATGKEIKARVCGVGDPVVGTSHGTKFDTEKADALANNFYEDGTNKFRKDGTAQELYVDQRGRFFFALYNADGTARIKETTPELAKEFMDQYANKSVPVEQ